MFEFSKVQKEATELLSSWFNSKNTSRSFCLGGYAGTGKSTLISHIRDYIRCGPIAYVAFTGKAAMVLKRKLYESYTIRNGDYCGTIHGLIYEPIIDKQTNKLIGWRKKNWNELEKYSLMIVDEASMVSEEIWEHLLYFEIPIITVGDCFQLPPVEGTFNVMDKPDITLTEIHRQAEGNPIIDLSMRIRKDGNIPYKIFGPSVVKVPRKDPLVSSFLKSTPKDFKNTMILCGFNKTRVTINEKVRTLCGYKESYPEDGERLICLKNNHNALEIPVYNGTIGSVLNCNNMDEFYEIILDVDGEEYCYDGAVSKECFLNSSPNIDFNRKVTRLRINNKIKDMEAVEEKMDYFDFGYCMTVHKAQGSQAKRVMLIEERFPNSTDENFARWLYTGVTRAEHQLLIVR